MVEKIILEIFCYLLRTFSDVFYDLLYCILICTFLLVKIWNILEMSDHEISISQSIEIHENEFSITVTVM